MREAGAFGSLTTYAAWTVPLHSLPPQHISWSREDAQMHKSVVLMVMFAFQVRRPASILHPSTTLPL